MEYLNTNVARMCVSRLIQAAVQKARIYIYGATSASRLVVL